MDCTLLTDSWSLLPQEMGLKVGQEASFAVQLNGARGLVDAKIHTPSGAIEECYITELDSGKTRQLSLSSKKRFYVKFEAVTADTATGGVVCSTTGLQPGPSDFLNLI